MHITLHTEPGNSEPSAAQPSLPYFCLLAWTYRVLSDSFLYSLHPAQSWHIGGTWYPFDERSEE